MWTLYQYPLCPFSRTIRLLLLEKRIAHQLKTVFPWDADGAFLALNRAGQTPVIQWLEEASTRPDMRPNIITLADCTAMTEYFEETMPDPPFIGMNKLERAEVRRLAGWFHQIFYGEVGLPLLRERMFSRIVTKSAPDTQVMRAALTAADKHLSYIDDLIEARRWLAGAVFSLADIAAAAHISVADYLGGLNWERHEPAKQWYMTVKSRQSLRQLLPERMPGVAPPPHYDKLDF